MPLPENIQKWYREFLGIMIRKGYDIHDPMSNYALRGFLTERSEVDFDSNNCKTYYAGVPVLNGDYVNPPANGITDYSWMKANFTAPADFSEEQIRNLYDLSKKGHLAFYEKSCSGADKKLLYVDGKGSPVLSVSVKNVPPIFNFVRAAEKGEIPGIAIPPRPRHPGRPKPGSPDFEQQKKAEERYIKDSFKWYDDAMKTVRPLYLNAVKDHMPGCPDPVGYADTFAVFSREERQFFSSKWYTDEEAENRFRSIEWEDLFFPDYYSNPEYYAEREGAEARLRALEETFADPGNMDIPCRDNSDHAIIKGMIAKTGMTVKALCENGMITHEDGVPFASEKYGWNVIDKIDAEIRYKEKPVIICDHLENGVPAGRHKITYRDEKVRCDVPFREVRRNDVPKPFIPENMVADVTDGATEHAGNFMSSRTRMKVRMEDGTEIKGYFTPETNNDPDRKWRDIINNHISENKRAGSPEALKTIPFLEALRDRYTPYKYGELAEKLAGIDDADRIIARQPFANSVNRSSIRKFMKGLGLTDEYINEQLTTNNAFFAETANKIVEETIFFPDIDYTNKTAGIKKGANINRRNNAMTGMADLLGIGDIIARSVNMTLTSGNKNVPGTFMLNAKGIQCSEFSPLREGFGEKQMNISVTALQSMNKLQVLDYLCANLDRHAANFMYIFDTSGRTVKLTGVQGFDNDLSFGDIDHRGPTQLRRMSCLKDINVMDGKLAESVLALDPKSVEHMLRVNGMLDTEINAAKLRLTDLQDKILSHRMTLVPEGGWTSVNTASLNIGENSDNIFATVKRRIQHYNRTVLSEYRSDKASFERNHRQPDPQSDLAASTSVTENIKAQMAAQSKRLKAIRDSFIATDLKGSTDEFNKMYNSLGKLISLTDDREKLKNGFTDNDFNLMSQVFDETRKNCRNYIDLKREVPHTDRGKERLNLAKNLEAFCIDRRNTVMEESVAAMNVRLKNSIPEHKAVAEMEEELRLGVKPAPEKFGDQIRMLNTVSSARRVDLNLVALCGRVADKLIKTVGKDNDYITASGLTPEDLQKASKTISAGKEAEEKLKPAVRINDEKVLKDENDLII